MIERDVQVEPADRPAFERPERHDRDGVQHDVIDRRRTSANTASSPWLDVNGAAGRVLVSTATIRRELRGRGGPSRRARSRSSNLLRTVYEVVYWSC
jgi:hypothetical protein